MRMLSLLICTLLAFAPRLQAQTLPETGAYAIVDARVEVGDGHTLERGTILVRNGIIQAVGTDLKVPADAEVIKGNGLVAYPGFIDAGCTHGLKLPEWQPDQDRVPDTSALAPASMRIANRKWVRPELRARDCLSLTDAVIGPMRRNGFCAALLTPAGGIITGVSTLVNLSGQPRRECIVRASVGMHMSFNPTDGSEATVRAAPAGGTGYPGSLLGIIADLRQTLLDAGHHSAVQTGYEQSGGPRPPFDDCIDALQPVLGGSMPVIFAADSKNEIDRALHIADEFHLHLMLNGAGDAWKDAPLLAQKGIPVLASLNFGDEPGAPKPKPAGPSGSGGRQAPVPASDELVAADRDTVTATADQKSEEPKEEDDTPRAVIDDQHRKWEERVANVARLDKAGVSVALISSGLRNPADFWKNLRRAIKDGLPKQAALRALTLNPAKILGMDRQMGTLQAGKMANIVLMTGDFSEPACHVKYLIVDRSRFEPDTEPAPSTTPQVPSPADIDERESDKE